ncbi:hypothetical protein GCM10023205_03070 [Yinghuangia aomiensis]|uniref:Restriction endonuclease type IV Mrr domain-containing protein n=1 Tax=Yinghuangia aomiensis TaxID=676205 RepID=A0ABP9GLB3_9ACTN
MARRQAYGTPRRRSWAALGALLVLVEGVGIGAWIAVREDDRAEVPWLLGVSCAVGGAAAVAAWWRLTRGGRTAQPPWDRLGYARTSVLHTLGRMDPVRLGDHVAELCARDGVREVETSRVAGDARSVDVLGTLADGTRVVVRCRTESHASTVSGAVVERFGAVAAYAGRTLVLASTAGSFSPKARALAGRVQLVDQRALARWQVDGEVPAGLAAPAPVPEPGKARKPGRSPAS